MQDEYLKDIGANSDQRYFYLRAKCYHSFKKSEAPHDLHFTLCIVSGQVLHATCSCKAGRVGYCDHVLALMFKACKFSLFDSKATHDLCKDEDEQPDLACTSQLQKWHKKGRSDKISAQPIMEVTITKIKLDDTKSKEGVKCLLYEARSNPSHDVEAERKFKETLKDINPQMGLALMETKFGERVWREPSQIGSICSYQLSHTEANFVATVDISSMPRDVTKETELTYPRFPLSSFSDFV